MQNHCENKDEEIPSMNLCIDAKEACTNIPECMLTKEIQDTKQDEEHLLVLKAYIINGWPLINTDVRKGMQPYWTFSDDLAVIDSIALKDRRIVVPASLQQQV